MSSSKRKPSSPERTANKKQSLASSPPAALLSTTSPPTATAAVVRGAIARPADATTSRSAISNPPLRTDGAIVGENSSTDHSTSERAHSLVRVRAQLPTPLRPNHEAWAPWHDGCFYRARVSAALPNQIFELRYHKSQATIRLPLKDVQPNYHAESTVDELKNTNRNGNQCYKGRLVLGLCKTLGGVFIPGHILEFLRADRTATPWQPERVHVKFLHVLDIKEVVSCSDLKTMAPDSATKLNARGQPLYPLLHQTHHPSFAKLSSVPDPQRRIASVKQHGTLVFAKSPETNQYHMGTVLPTTDDGEGITVLFFQDPERKDIRDEVIAKVEEQLVMAVPHLPSLPPYPKDPPRKRVGLAMQRHQEAEKAWRTDQLFENAELIEGQWVSANWRKSPHGYESGYYVLGQVRKHSDKGYHVEILGRGPTSRPVILQRDDIRPLYRDGALVFTRNESAVWPSVVHKESAAKKLAYGRLDPWQTRILPEQDVPTLTYAKKHEGRYVTKSAWSDVFALAMFKKGRTDAPAVHAQTRHDLVGTLDASDPNFLVVFTPDEQHSYAKPIKVLIHGNFAVQWLKERSKGVRGIQVKVLHDGIPEIFTISVENEDEAAAKRIVRRMMEKLKHASDFPEKYAGNSTGTNMIDEE
ncbi:hypothetical protein LTR97_003008 [Elasticomyces elasticus]|uniref:Uncharacterized protein n=1 Tax=Elasticomyces elasticus TaxID=574655 RepID=A0AAN7WDV2_9PEZI|nr:hypothetical protein LTR97_003008 [Elasticomyces elasticus]KAK5725797.1 hypothetical protein LTR15_003987 [Elasticomyces elasticus]